LDEEQVRRSTDEFLDRLEGQQGQSVVYPFELVPPAREVSDRDDYRRIAIESSRWIREGKLRGLLQEWNDHPDDLFKLIGYRFQEYRDSTDTLRRGDPSTHMEVYKIIGRWDRSEHDAIFSDLERLQITNLLRRMGDTARGDFNWMCVRRPGQEKGHQPPEEIEQIMAEHVPGPANNHQTFANFSVYTVETYFDRYYEIPDAQDWLRWVDTFMSGQLATSKPQEDCTGYHHITMNHTSMYAAATQRWEYFRRDPMYQFIRLEYISHDNMGSETSYGDHGSYHTAMGPDFLDETVDPWMQWSGGRMEPQRVVGDELLGIYAHRLEPMYYRYQAQEDAPALGKCFDKLTFREEIDPGRAYLLLDGVSYGYHGHHDGNAMLRFTDDNRCWLGDIASYFGKPPKDHNTVTLMRNAEGDSPPTFNSLEAAFETPTWASTTTRSMDYASMNWDRHIIWHRPSDTFFMLDEAAALEPGSYDVKARFRGHGEPELDGRVWSLEQEGGVRFYMHLPGSGILTTSTAPDYAKYWKNYPHADPTPQLLNHRLVSDLEMGERIFLKSAFYANGTETRPRLTARDFGPSTMIVQGALNAIVGADSMQARGVEIDARQFVLADDTLYMVDGVSAKVGNCAVTAEPPVDLALDLGEGTGTVSVDAPGTLSLELIPGRQDAAATVTVDLGKAPTTLYLDGREIRPNEDGVFVMELRPGTHDLRGDLSALAGAIKGARGQMWAAAGRGDAEGAAQKPTANVTPGFSYDLPSAVTTTAIAELDGDDSQETLVGCEDGTLVALDAAGNRSWQVKFDGRVNDIASADLDGDGQDEVLCGVNDEHLHVLDSDGSELWKKHVQAFHSNGGGPGHVTVVLPADFDGDGDLEIAYGSENTFFYVVDAEGNPIVTGDEAWEVQHGHTAYSAAAADITGDGQKELFATWQWRTRWITDFTKPNQRARKFYVGGGSGGSIVTTADINGDGTEEGVFGGLSGGLVIATGRQDRDQATIGWEKTIGDDVISALVPADYDGDGSAEVAVASHSGFLALVRGDGTVDWVRYADHRVTDAALVDLPGGPAVARTSADGTVAVYGGDGEEIARWNVGGLLSEIQTLRAGDRTILVVVTDSEIKTATLED
ncbi:MAG: FG-GAP repeat domain-containing protein, partial [Armatimonadota bacterium]